MQESNPGPLNYEHHANHKTTKCIKRCLITRLNSILKRNNTKICADANGSQSSKDCLVILNSSDELGVSAVYC